MITAFKLSLDDKREPCSIDLIYSICSFIGVVLYILSIKNLQFDTPIIVRVVTCIVWKKMRENVTNFFVKNTLNKIFHFSFKAFYKRKMWNSLFLIGIIGTRIASHVISIIHDQCDNDMNDSYWTINCNRNRQEEIKYDQKLYTFSNYLTSQIMT